MRHRVLGRGVAARHGRLGAARRATSSTRRSSSSRATRSATSTSATLVEFHREKRRRRHDRPEVGRQPARVRDRRHRRGRPDRALPREAVVGPGLLRHDQHRHLRARARGAAARPDRPAVRLLEGALPAAARDGPAAVRLRARRLLAGHRQPRPVPAGELRRARRARSQLEHPRDPAARQHLDRRGRRPRRPRPGRGARVHRQQLPASRARRASGRTRCSARTSTLRERARIERSVIDAATHIGRSAIVEGAIVGRSCDLRTHVRLHEGVAIGDEVTIGAESVDLPRRPHLPVQGGRVRRADPLEPDLGVARAARACSAATASRG